MGRRRSRETLLAETEAWISVVRTSTARIFKQKYIENAHLCQHLRRARGHCRAERELPLIVPQYLMLALQAYHEDYKHGPLCIRFCIAETLSQITRNQTPRLSHLKGFTTKGPNEHVIGASRSITSLRGLGA